MPSQLAEADFLRPFRASGQEPQVLQILDPEGRVVDDALLRAGPMPSTKDLLAIYEAMVTARVLDRQASILQRQGRMKGTYAFAEGQEATEAASAYALRPGDALFVNYRQLAALTARGVPLIKICAKFFANSGDPSKGRQMPAEFGFMDYNVPSAGAPVGSSITHAVGAAYAMKYLKRKDVALVYFGDGATSTGDFHVGANFAAVFDVPLILLCENNQYAISLPVSKQTKVTRLSVKAVAYGIEGFSVDGNDAIAVYKLTKYAAEKAREGGGPTMIEAITYRLSPHTTADDPLTKYRPKDEVELWKRRDPILRLSRYLASVNALSEQEDRELWARVEAQVKEAIKQAEALPPPPPRELITDVFGQVPWHLEEEFREIAEALGLEVS
ncbi:MAG: pyruvate dehydrogenase [Nitrososphaerota archaeon]